MKIGVNALPEVPTWDSYAQLAKTCEQLGFDSFWTYDHLVSTALGGPGPTLECFTSLAALAAITTKITLGSLVLANEFRHPSIVAKSAATIASIAPGRFVLGISAGSNPAEHKAFGMPFPTPGERVSRLQESVSAIRELLHGNSVTLQGDVFPMQDAQLCPAPAPPPPILIGARGDRMLRVVAALADMHVSAATPEELGPLNERLSAHCEAVGRDPSSLSRCVIAYEAVAGSASRRDDKQARLELLFGRPFTELRERVFDGTIHDANERVQAYAAAGADHLFISAVPPYDNEFLAQFAQFAQAASTPLNKTTLEGH